MLQSMGLHGVGHKLVTEQARRGQIVVPGIPVCKRALVSMMENLVFIELIRRGYIVDVGVVELTRVKDGKKQQSQYEIDFVVNTGSQKVYIQSALNVDTDEKRNQETFSLKHSGDFFRKMVILDGNTKAWIDEDGITYIGIIPFLLEESLLNL